MSDPETSFSIEVLGFPGEADPDVVAASIADFFGIPLDEGRRLVRKVPVRVKRNAPTDVTQTLVKQLRKLGAEVRVRNEQTGDERIYRRDSEVPSRRSPDVARTPPEDTLESEDPPAGFEERPRVDVLDAAAIPEPADIGGAGVGGPAGGIDGAFGEAAGDRPSPLEVTSPSATDAFQSRSAMPSRPGEAIPTSEPGPSTPRPAQLISLPPPSSPVGASIPPPSRGSLDFCGSCKSPVERGDICARCGWSNTHRVRHCRQCKKKLVIASKVSKSPVILGAIALVSVALAGGLFFLFGLYGGVAALVFGGAIGFATDGSTVRYACKTCTIAVYTERLLKEEEGHLAAARRKSYILAGVIGVAAVGLFVVPAGAPRKLVSSSFGVGWSVQVPSTHSRSNGDTVMVQTPLGQKRLRYQYAQRGFLAGPTYFLANLQLTYPAAPPEPNKPAVQSVLDQAIKNVWTGSVTGAIEPVGEGFQATFSGTFEGKPVFGRARATQYDHDVVVVAVTGPDAAALRDASIERYLSNVAVQRDAK